MKAIHTLLLLVALFLLSSCGNSKVDRPEPVLTPTQITQQNQAAPMGTVGTPGTAPDGTILHYYCPNECAGSGGDAQGSCPTCGTAYVHNQAWHTAQQQVTTQDQPMAEPAQNAAGVWHYTCPKGCDGGAGSAIACASCGSTLEHNQAYHN